MEICWHQKEGCTIAKNVWVKNCPKTDMDELQMISL